MHRERKEKMNAQSVVIWYESGSCDDVSAPDLAFENGFVFASEFVDVSDPDSGIWWERDCLYVDPEAEETSDDNETMSMVHNRFCIASAETLSSAVQVDVHGQTVLVRDREHATTKCGLVSVFMREREADEDPEGTADDDELSSVLGEDDGF